MKVWVITNLRSEITNGHYEAEVWAVFDTEQKAKDLLERHEKCFSLALEMTEVEIE